jgi:hypothetical protein
LFEKTPFGYDATTPIHTIINLYKKFHDKANNEITILQKKEPNLIKNINNILLDK